MDKAKTGFFKRNRRKLILIVSLLVVLLIGVVVGLMLNEQSLQYAYPLKHTELIIEYSEEYVLSPALVAAVIHTESGFNEDAVSPKGAVGLMQIMPSTGEWIAEKLKLDVYDEDMLKDPELNIEMGCWFLNFLMERFDHMDTVLAAYNSGPANVRKWLEDESLSNDGVTLDDIPFKETENYVKRVNDAWKHYLELYGDELY